MMPTSMTMTVMSLLLNWSLLLLQERGTLGAVLLEEEKCGKQSKESFEDVEEFVSLERDQRIQSGGLSRLIENGHLKEARHHARVHHLGGTLAYSGFLTVDEEHDSHLFFVFFPAWFHSKTAPVVLMIGGGPQESVLFSLFLERGPFWVDGKLKIRARSRSLMQMSNVIHMDVAVGSGFSFTGNASGYPRNEEDVADNAYKALEQLYKLFPDLKSRELIIIGESFSGKFGPSIAAKIHKENEKMALLEKSKSDTPMMNLKALAISDGVFDEYPGQHLTNFLYSLHIINNTFRPWYHWNEFGAKEVAIMHHHEMDNDWCDPSMYASHMRGFSVIAERFNREHRRFFLNSDEVSLVPILGLRWSNLAPSVRHATKLLNNRHFRRAMHLDSTHFSHLGTELFQHVRPTLSKDVKPAVEELLGCKDCYRILFIISQDSPLAPNIISDSFIKNLKWAGQVAFAKADKTVWHVHDRHKPGSVLTYKALTKLVVRNTGHFYPLLDRKIYMEMMESFIIGEKLD